MPYRFGFDAKAPSFELAELKRLANLAESAFGQPGFSGFSPMEQQVAAIRSNGKLSAKGLDGLAITNFSVSGQIPPGSIAPELLINILESGHAFLGREGTGMIGVEAGFAQIDSVKKQDGSAVKAEYREGHGSLWLQVLPDMSRGAEEASQRIEGMFRTAELPLKVEIEDGAYYITHEQGAGLTIRASSAAKKRPKANPASLSCDIPNATATDLVRRMKCVWEKFAQPGSLRAEWQALGGLQAQPAVNQRLFESLTALNLPAKKTDLTLFYTLQDFDGIESLRHMGGAKNTFCTCFCTFKLPDDEAAELSAVTTAQGHKLSGTISDLESLKLVEQALGLELVWNNPG